MNERRAVLILFLAAITVRILMLVAFQNEVIVGSDQVDYINLGRNLAEGNFWGVLHTYWPPLFPALIGIVSVFADGLVLPAAIVAIVTGSLAVPLTYCLVRQATGHSAALIAGVLAVFYAHLLNSVFVFGSENLYLVLLTGCLITAWKAITTLSTKYSLFTGALLGLAYLTRPEAFAYPAFFIGLILLEGRWQKDSFKRALRCCAVLVFMFLVIAAPYLIYLRAETGAWTISGKTEVNTIMGDYTQVSQKTATADEDESPAPGPIKTVKVFAYLALTNLIEIHKSMTYLLPLPVLAFASLGLFSSAWGRGRLRWELYLIGFCIVTVIGYTMAVVQTRYFYILLPIIFGWTARGIVDFSHWYRHTVKRWSGSDSSMTTGWAISVICLAVLAVFLLPANFFMRNNEWRDRPYEERAAGLWLKENAPPRSIVFSARKLPAFYSESIQVTPVSTDFEEVFRQILTGNAEYVVASDRALKRNPFLEELPARLGESADFELVYTHADNPEYRIFIFRRKSE